MGSMVKVMSAWLLPGMAARTVAARADDPAREVGCWIDVQHEDRLLVVTPDCRAGVARDLAYPFVSSKAGRSGASRSAQCGRVSVEPGQTRALARVTLGVSGRDSYRLALDAYDGDRLVGSASASYPPAP